jgi:predicted protein tyrosine phosphatase
MIEINKSLYVGNEYDCAVGSVLDRAVVHACKHPCHVGALGYRGSLPQSHPNYLVAERERNLYLNMVDMDRELSPIYTNPIMEAAMKFISENIVDREVLIHCNQGQSRAPSIGLLYLAREGQISADSYETATAGFRGIYPAYQPARGIALYLARNWEQLIQL